VDVFGIVVEHSPNLMELFSHRNECPQLSVVRVFLDGHRPFGIEIVRDARRGHELKTFKAAVPGVIENRIDDNIPWLQMPADDRANFGGICSGIPVFRVVAEFEIRGVEEFSFRRMRPGEEKANFAAVN
jgi:hypothetical protein